MRMRLKPLRGAPYKTIADGDAIFLARISDDKCRILLNEQVMVCLISSLQLPVIETKNYEKIEDEKYKGD